MDPEFYSTMYAWFEKCGIISNVRTHLRQNLINALKNKEVNLKADASTKSAKQYVYDLLIAEYLFNHNYAYTLSVFASEAPLLINFPNATAGASAGNREKLQGDYVSHALETLGIDPRDAKGEFVVSEYVDSDTPLLLCILKCLATFPRGGRVVALPEEKSFCSRSTQTDFSWRSFRSDLEKLHAFKKKIVQHKRAVDSELREREVALKEQAVLVEEQLASLNAKLRQVQGVMRSVSLKEKQLAERKENDEELLQRKIDAAVEEKLQQETQRFAKVADLPRNAEVQTDVGSDALREERVEALTKEKEELANLVREQQTRIEQITQRALQLSRQVEEINALRPTSTEIPAQTLVSESSSTEDILQDAKLRLKRLEEESLKADRYYYNFLSTSS